MGKGHSFTGHPERYQVMDELYDPEIAYGKRTAERRERKKSRDRVHIKHRGKGRGLEMDMEPDYMFEEEDYDQYYDG
jgi:hypothetical protein